MYLTEHFSLEELVASQTAVRLGIDNTPSPEILATLRGVLAPGLERVRTALAHQAVLVTSGYRSPALNAAVGGSRDSAHMQGLAADVICPRFGSPLEVCRAVVAAGIEMDTVISEGQWCHVSFAPAKRRLVMTAHFTANGVTYTPGLA
jgi:zinc D-Ala-D-Ala carboxypeptidase